MVRIREALRKLDVDLRDLHCYGGILLAGMGAALFAPGAGLLLAGAALFYLALRKVD